MDLTDLNTLRSFLGKNHLRLSKDLSQNFLINREVLEKIVTAAELHNDDTVLEIGPGAGSLTVELASRAGTVVAVEKDRHLARILATMFKRQPHVSILQNDILKVRLSECLPTGPDGEPLPFKLVANIPYQITGEILRRFLSKNPRPHLVVLLVQKEVAERICAGPGEMSILALSVQYYGRPEIVSFVSKDNFFPQPKVDSAILKIKTLPRPAFAADEKKLFWIIHLGFSARRKTLCNNLSAGTGIDKRIVSELLIRCGLGASARAQELTLEHWKKLLDLLPDDFFGGTLEKI